MKKYKINVTKRDIEKWVATINSKAQGGTCADCAVARAARRHKDLKNAKMGYNTLATNPEDSDFVVIVPGFVSQAIRKMDKGEIVPPFSFTITTP